MTQLWKGEEIFRSDCELQIAPSDIDFFKDDATACDLIMQSRCHKFIATLSILKKNSHTLRSSAKLFSMENWELLPYCLLCRTALLGLMKSWKGRSLGDDLAENGKFGLTGVQITEVVTSLVV